MSIFHLLPLPELIPSQSYGHPQRSFIDHFGKLCFPGQRTYSGQPKLRATMPDRENVQRTTFRVLRIVHVQNSFQTICQSGTEVGCFDDEEIAKEGKIDLL